jgi:membrane associated rhomboid family serine protease
MFPLWDNVPSQREPFVNYGILIACVVMFFIQLTSPRGDENVVRKLGMIPFRVTHPDEQQLVIERPGPWGLVNQQVIDLSSPVSPILTMITCLFLHGGWMHIIGNMWFLFIFGDNVEDRFGHVGYLLFFLISGLAAGFMHILADSTSLVPTIGASGAIAGIMGAYLLLYPRSEVMTLIPLGIFSNLIPIPAPIFLGIWFIIQLVSGIGTDPSAGGVAWWAHVGGFVGGAAITALLRNAGFLNPPPPPAPRASDRPDVIYL